MTRPERSPFYRLREFFQDALGLAPGITDKRRRLAGLMVRRADEDIFARTGELVSWIGVTKLAKAMVVDRRTVQRGIAWLLEAGVIEVERKGGGRGRSTRYRFSKRWLAMAADTLEKSGIADAYGLPDDLFAFANSGTFASLAGQYSGEATAHDAAMGGVHSQISGVGTGVSFGKSGDMVENSGDHSAHPARPAEMGGALPGPAGKTAATASRNSGNFSGNSGRPVPPEIDLNSRNNSGARAERAARSEQDRRQGFMPLPLPGGRKGDVDVSGSSGGTENPALDRLRQRAVRLLGDENRADLALRFLKPETMGKILGGFRASDEDLAKWLGWALDDAEAAGVDIEAAGTAAAPADRLAVVERQAAETAAQVGQLSALVAELVTALRAVMPAGAGGTVAA